jgi:hypothetical protein
VTRSLAAELRANPPLLQAGGECWGLEWAALGWLEERVEPGTATLETGAGTSTIVFAARGAEHEAVTPSADEAERVRTECRRRGIAAENVRFHIGPSHEVLARWPGRPLDLVLIDGAHGFPYPVLDWWYLAPHLRVGGFLVVDDAYMPAVATLVDHLRASPAWEIVPAPGYRTVAARKRSDDRPAYEWKGRRGVSFGYLAPGRRLLAAVRYRALDTGVGEKLVSWAVRRRARKVS